MEPETLSLGQSVQSDRRSHRTQSPLVAQSQSKCRHHLAHEKFPMSHWRHLPRSSVELAGYGPALRNLHGFLLFEQDNHRDHLAASSRSLVLGAFAPILDGESPPSETPGELRHVIEIPISQSLLRLCAEGSIFDLSAGGHHSQITLRNSIPPNSPIVLLHLERCSVQGPGQSTNLLVLGNYSGSQNQNFAIPR